MSLLAENAIREHRRLEAQRPTSVGISNRRDTGHGYPTLGTIGFYAVVNGTRQGELVFVSNRHVLLADGGLQGDPIYRFCRPGHGEVTCDGDSLASVSDEGSEENHRYAYPGEEASEYFVDCATAHILHPESFPPYEISVRRVARLHPLDVISGRSCRVRKFGNGTGLTEGRVVNAAATVRSGKDSRSRNLVIRGIDGRFAEPGDSGALIVNERNEAVGLLWGRDDNDPDISYGCHIHPVLDRLGVTMLTQGMPWPSGEGMAEIGGSYE